jgi:hypothetical protein
MDAYSMGCDDIDPIQLAEAQIPIDLPAEPEPHATMAPNPAETRLLCEDASKYPYNVPVADGSLVNSAQPSASGRTTSRKRKAPTKRDEDWELVKKRIIELHGTKTLSYIMTDVKQRYGFTARSVWRSSDHFVTLAHARVVKDSSSRKSINGV